VTRALRFRKIGFASHQGATSVAPKQRKYFLNFQPALADGMSGVAG